jgi:ribulose-phosphate 3-epimerase
MLDRRGSEAELEVDGGVKIANIARISHAGADVFVAGSAVFGSPDYGATIAEMKRLAQETLL